MPRVAEGIVLPDGLKRSKGVARSHPGLLRGGGHRRAALGFANHIKQLTKVAVQSTLSSYKGCQREWWLLAPPSGVHARFNP